MNNELYECHGHLMMDGADYKMAKRRHSGHVDTEFVRAEFADLRSAGVAYFRDGGDAFDVSRTCRSLAADYGIDYVTPVFAIHRKGYYGGIVGRPFSDKTEFLRRIDEVREAGGDFVKLIVSGIISFEEYGELSCPSLSAEEIEWMIRTAHEAGFSVMVHVNGKEAVRACVNAGADSIEHGYFQDRATLELLASSGTVWVPTLAATAAFIGRDGFREDIARRTLDGQMKAVRYAVSCGAAVACGSDSGAVGVPHGAGTLREMELLDMAGAAPSVIDAGNRRIRELFRRGGNQ